jgi:hypothetical protein
MDALAEEREEERTAWQEQMQQLETAHGQALQEAALRLDQALQDLRRQHEDERRQLRQQLELEHELEFDAFKQKYTTGELNKVRDPTLKNLYFVQICWIVCFSVELNSNAISILLYWLCTALCHYERSSEDASYQTVLHQCQTLTFSSFFAVCGSGGRAQEVSAKTS